MGGEVQKEINEFPGGRSFGGRGLRLHGYGALLVSVEIPRFEFLLEVVPRQNYQEPRLRHSLPDVNAARPTISEKIRFGVQSHQKVTVPRVHDDLVQVLLKNAVDPKDTDKLVHHLFVQVVVRGIVGINVLPQFGCGK